MADVGRGLPLLSGPPPVPAESESACRKCNKEFNIIFARSRRCNHCGYAYCHSCTDFLALMPRGGNESGYDAQSVCAYCIEYLNITAAGRRQLRSMPIGKLRKYVNAYNIKVGRVVEKDDLIDRIISARGRDGCLPPECEAFYRRYSIPVRPDGTRPRGLFSSRTQSDLPPATAQIPQRQATQEFARPDLAPDEPPPVPPRYQPPPGPPPGHRPPPTTPPRPQYYHTPPPVPPRPPQPQPPSPNNNSRPWNAFPGQTHPYANPSASHSSHNFHMPSNSGSSSTPPRPRAASASPSNRTMQPPPPSLDELLSMSETSIAALSIGNLKTVLFNNHVNAGLILEKAELVKKVRDLVDDERRERERMERQHQMEEQEEQERIRLHREMVEEEERRRRERESQAAREQERATESVAEASSSAVVPEVPIETDTDVKMEDVAPPKPVPSTTPSKAHVSAFERNGLCVICQDEEANIAIVDCGHMAMCRGCSDLVMSSSRECPLCRTRIVTEARLLRIFKT